jgi:hypothetical protein
LFSSGYKYFEIKRLQYRDTVRNSSKKDGVLYPPWKQAGKPLSIGLISHVGAGLRRNIFAFILMVSPKNRKAETLKSICY